MNKILQEKIVWINSTNKDSGTNNNFFYQIYGYLHPEAKNITFQLINALISPSTVARFFIVAHLKILIDFGVSHNQSNANLNNFLIGGIISPTLTTRYLYSDVLGNPGPVYKIYGIPSGIINIRLIDETNSDLYDSAFTPPGNVTLCLKFTYEI